MTGQEAESKAQQYLEAKGYIILQRNFSIPQGEIDLVAEDEEEIVFIEVKYLKNPRYYFPEEQITAKKKRNLQLAAQAFLQKRKLNQTCRFDVIAIQGTEAKLKFDHYEDAIEFNT